MYMKLSVRQEIYIWLNRILLAKVEMPKDWMMGSGKQA